MNGKGSKPRPVNQALFRENYDLIFKKMHEHPEASQHQEFHESKQFVADGQQVVLVDIDETICFYGETRRYDLAEPNKDNIAKINKLYDEGWYVIYWTARGGSEKSKKEGNRFFLIIDLKEILIT